MEANREKKLAEIKKLMREYGVSLSKLKKIYSFHKQYQSRHKTVGAWKLLCNNIKKNLSFYEARDFF